MTLEGLSKYDIVLKEGGDLTVRHKKTGRILKGTNFKGNFYYCLQTDAGHPSGVRDHMLRYLAENNLAFVPGSMMKCQVTFTKEGKLISKRDIVHKKQYSVFQNLDDVEHTVRLLRKFHDGDESLIMEWLENVREKAAYQASMNLNKSVSAVIKVLPQGEELFLSQIKECNVRRLMPLYAWLCKCIKHAFLRSQGEISIDRISYKHDTERT